NEPYPPLNGCSDPFNGPQAPNGDPEADAALSVVSHEANESITDTYNTWIDANGYEDGDECSYTYGAPLGSTGVAHPGASGTMYNQTINGAHYFTQDEFSNTDYLLGQGDVNSTASTRQSPTKVAGCIQRPAATPYHPLSPARIADTRPGSGQPDAGRTLAAGQTLTIQVAGTGGVPAGATAAVLNVTATGPTAAGFLTAYPTGSTRPMASTLNFKAGTTVPNLVEVGLGPGGQMSLYNPLGSTDAVVDVEGWVGAGGAPAGAYNALSPARIADTRPASGQPNAGMTMGPGKKVVVQVDGAGGVPLTGVSAVVLNVTATNTTAFSVLTAYPDGTTLPLASNLNFAPGQTVANRVIVPVSAGGKVDLYNAFGSVDAVVDVSGWFTDTSNPSATGTTFSATGPTRLADTRPGSGEPDAGMTLGPGGTVRVPVVGTGGVPAGVSAVVVNVTVTNTTAPSFLSAYPTGQTTPQASDLNWAPGDTRANLAIVRPGSDGTITLFNDALSVDAIVDVTGYYK
ncbi:MAG: hypothetical protein M3Y36_09190, partial [Actinomycetota bacterium]|nr:hypothetical protein [Actinomycetota bacterium]